MQNQLDYIASNFAVTLSESYSLSIQQTLDGYSFCVVDENSRECVAIKHVKIDSAHQQRIGILKEEPLLQLRYNRTLFFGRGAFALVPLSLYTPENCAIFLPIEEELQKRAKILSCDVAPNVVLVSNTNQWQTPTSICEMHDMMELLIKYALHDIKRDGMWAIVSEECVDIVVKREQKLVLVNSYPSNGMQDIAYYILACYQQLELSHETIELTLMGEMHNPDLAPDRFLSDYIRHITIATADNWRSTFDKEYASYFTLLIKSSELCES